MTIKRWQLILEIMRNTNIVTAEQDNKGEMSEVKKLHNVGMRYIIAVQMYNCILYV